MTWYVYGILVALVLGIYNFLYGLLARNINSSTVLVGLGIGIIAVGLIVKLLTSETAIEVNKLKFPVLIGLVLGLGVFLVTKAFADPNAKVSQLIPLINANTLVSVVLGLTLLKEYQTAPLLKVILGTLLILFGSIVIR